MCPDKLSSSWARGFRGAPLPGTRQVVLGSAKAETRRGAFLSFAGGRQAKLVGSRHHRKVPTTEFNHYLHALARAALVLIVELAPWSLRL